MTVTLGATEAIFSAVQALVGSSGDEVIVFDPAYDFLPSPPSSWPGRAACTGAAAAAVPATTGGTHRRRHCSTSARASIDHQFAAQSRLQLHPRREDLLALGRAAASTAISAADFADEVYEHIACSTARRHHSVLSLPELRERSVAVFSFGKTLHATGLRVGYAVAPPPLTAELRKVHQYNTFTIATGVAMGDRPLPDRAAAEIRRAAFIVLCGQARSLHRGARW